MRSFFSAVRFLTKIPLPDSWSGGTPELGRSIPFFPVVGLLIGVVVAALDYGLGYLLPVLPASVLVVVALLAASGCLHIDGLADTADGFLSSRPRERILEIMKDSRSGPMGVVAVVSVILLKVALLSTVVGDLRPGAVLLAPVAGRCALVVTMAILPYARPEGGLGSVFAKRRSVLQAVWALALLISAGWTAAGLAGLTAGIASFVVTLLFAGYMHSKIGGWTGDTLGASCEIAETVPLLVTAVWIYVSV